ncbi:MAG: hypothetical protein R3F54_15240 [Alphaproteobacteria bacterium]
MSALLPDNMAEFGVYSEGIVRRYLDSLGPQEKPARATRQKQDADVPELGAVAIASG